MTVSLPLSLFPPEYRLLKRVGDEMDGKQVDLTSENSNWCCRQRIFAC